MQKYPNIRVCTVGELERGDILHSGIVTDNICMRWEVMEMRFGCAVMRVGGETGTQVLVTGKSIREFEMYREDDCPYCNPKVDYMMRFVLKMRRLNQERRFSTLKLDRPAIESSFNFRDARRYGTGRTMGAAFIRNIDGKGNWK